MNYGNTREHGPEKQGGITRRSFLKTTGALAGAAAVVGSAAPLTALAQDYSYGQVETAEEKIFRGVCHPNCFGYCHLNVHVRDGKIVKTSRGDYKDPRYSRICQRGLSHVQRTYDPTRIGYPLRRVEGSERGANEWERITWDEAIAEVAGKIKEIQEKYGPQAVGFYHGSNMALTTLFYFTRFVNGFNLTNIGPAVDNAAVYAEKVCVGGDNWESNERADLVNAKSIVAWGDNLTVAQHHNWHFVKEAMQGGTKLVCIDPTFTQLAAKADKWIRVKRGTDNALLLALVREVIERDDIDKKYAKAHTVAPFLVRSDTGKYLRASEVSNEVAQAKTAAEKAAKEVFDKVFADSVAAGMDQAMAGMAAGQAQAAMAFDDQPMVLQDGKPVAANEATDPDLFASYTHDGVKCDTALSLLKDSVKDMTYEHAAEICEIPVSDIEYLYDVCVDGPVTHAVGYGSQAYVNGVHTWYAGYTLCGLLGNIGKPGAAWGACWTMFTGFNAMYLFGAGMATSATVSILDVPNVIKNQKFLGQDYPFKMMITMMGNPISMQPDTNAWRDDALANLDYVVTLDCVMTDTARYSDMILPVAHYFEHPDVTAMGEVACLAYSEKAIDPLYESKTDLEILQLIAEQLGKGDLFPTDYDQVANELLSGDACDALGVSLPKLKEEKEMRYYLDEPHIGFRDGAFKTPTGRLEFYHEDPQPRVVAERQPSPERIEFERLPRWWESTEVASDNENANKYPLVCTSERNRFMVHSQWFSTPLLRELDPEPFVKMNPADAAERGLDDGQYVEVYNDYGHVVARLVYSEAIRPGMLVYPKGFQHDQYKAGCWSEIINDHYDEFAVNSNFMDVICDVRAWEGK